MRPWLMRAAFAFVAAAGVIAPASDAHAHGGPTDDETSSNYRTRIKAITPPLAGVAVQVIDAGTRLALTNRGETQVVVQGYEGEPYLRVGPDGVFENRRSPATYLNATRDGSGAVPDDVDPLAPPEWRRVSTARTARWHDHRAHWMGRVAPAEVQAARDVEHVIFDPWIVPLEQGSAVFELRGDLAWVPPPSSARWWTTAFVAFALGAVALLRTSSAWLRAGALALVAVLDVVGTAGVVAASVASTFNRASQFLYAALIALAALHVARRARRACTGPHLAAGLAALLAVGMSGAARVDGFANSQVATSLPGLLDRWLTVGVLAIGAALLVDFVAGLVHRPGPTSAVAHGAWTGVDPTPELVP